MTETSDQPTVDRILVEMTISAPADQVWDALQDRDKLYNWFGWEADSLRDEIDYIFFQYTRPDKEAGILWFEGVPDRFEIELLPYESVELKYELAEGAPMIFAWRATGPVNYDMHAHPYEGGVDLTESYSITDAPAQAALYIAPFTGIHGWYWQNRSMQPVTLTLDATGAITASKIFDPAGEHVRALTPPGDEDSAEVPAAGA